MTDLDRAEMRALADQFREAMAREMDQPLFDEEARMRIGRIIGGPVRQGRSDYVALRRR